MTFKADNSRNRKGIILAGGSGTRLYPITMGVSKQLLPVFDKPMIYYPLSVLMLAGIKEIAIITTPHDQDQFKRALGDGSQWGIDLTYFVQEEPKGLAQAYTLTEEFLNGEPSALILGDNLFFGANLPQFLDAANKAEGGTVFGYRVSDPERYGVMALDKDKRVSQIIEKPETPPSNFAVTGLYFLDGDAPEIAHRVKPSPRGEYEIVDVLAEYLDRGVLNAQLLGRGFAWLDTGTHNSLLDAGTFVRTLSARQGLLIGSPDEVAFSLGWMSRDQLKERVKLLVKSQYGQQLSHSLDDDGF